VHANVSQIISSILLDVIRSTSRLYLVHTATNSLRLSTDIGRNITLSERRVCSDKSSLRWQATSNDICPSQLTTGVVYKQAQKFYSSKSLFVLDISL